MSNHITGKVYDLTQENMNKLIAELEYYKEMKLRYNQLLDDTSSKQLVELQTELESAKAELEIHRSRHYEYLFAENKQLKFENAQLKEENERLKNGK